MEEHSCHHLAIQEWNDRIRQYREQLRAASAHIQRIHAEAQVDVQAAEGAQRRPAISEAEK
eukprot:6178266-Pyramimonas_sp.AAC.1